MKRPLRTALANALHLRDSEDPHDQRHHGHPGPAGGSGGRPARCGMVPCGLDQSGPESDGPPDLGRPEYGRTEHGRPVRGAGKLPERRRPDPRRIDYRTPPPDLCGPAGTKPGAGGGTGHRTGVARNGASPDGPGEDTLFLFLKSLHQFLTAPQDVATARSAPPVRSEPSPATDATAVAEDGGGHRPAPDGPTGPDDPV